MTSARASCSTTSAASFAPAASGLRRTSSGDDALGIVNRGSYNTLTAYPGKAFDNNYTLNTVDICPVGALTSKDFRFQMRVWFLKETKSICTSCATGCNILIGSREEKIYRYTPRENDAVNGPWMCDAGRLNYKWIGREDRLTESPKSEVQSPRSTRLLVGGADGNCRIIEESSARFGGHHRLGAADERGTVADFKIEGEARRHQRFRSPHGRRRQIARQRGQKSEHERRAIDRHVPQIRWEQTCRRSPRAFASGKIKTLIVFGEDVTQHGIGADLLGKLETLIVSDILPNATTKLAHYLLPGCAHAEKRGTFTNTKGRVQKFMKAVEPPGDARPEWEFLHDLVYNVTGQDGFLTIEGLFNEMAKDVPAFNGLTWAGLGDTGVTVKI